MCAGRIRDEEGPGREGGEVRRNGQEPKAQSLQDTAQVTSQGFSARQRSRGVWHSLRGTCKTDRQAGRDRGGGTEV